MLATIVIVGGIAGLIAAVAMTVFGVRCILAGRLGGRRRA